MGDKSFVIWFWVLVFLSVNCRGRLMVFINFRLISLGFKG